MRLLASVAPRSARVLLPALVFLLLAACSAPPPTGYPFVVQREPTVDILDYDIAVDVDHEAGFLTGRLVLSFRALSSSPAQTLVLDAVDLDVTGAWDAGGRELVVNRRPGILSIHLPVPVAPGEQSSIRLEWTCFPRRGLTFVPPSGRAPGRPWHIWTQGQSEDTRHWMPVWDIPNDSATHTLEITLDAGLMTLAAGERVDSFLNERTGRRTETWRMDVPHVSYLLTFLAGGFARGELGGAEIPLPVLADPIDLPAALEATRHTASILEFMERFTAHPYPYNKYAQTFVHDFTAGGMENVSATTLYYEGIHRSSDEPSVDQTGLVAHELAHQWFGDLLCGRGWKEIWINEGFANYCEALFMGELQGPAEMGRILRDWQRAYCATEQRNSHPIVWGGFEHPDDVFDEHIYEGAAARLHLLRDQIGSDAFLSGLRTFVADSAGGVTTTGEFQACMEAASGRDLTRFFDEWFHAPGFPHIEGRLAGDHLRLVQTQAAGGQGWRELFHVELTVAWSRGGQEQHERVAFHEPTAHLELTGDGPVDWVRVDANGVLPGRVSLWQPESAWASQLREATDPLTRLLAAEWFAGHPWVREPDSAVDAPDAGPFPGPASREALAAAAREDVFVDVRVQALAALAAAPDAVAQMVFLDLSIDPDPRVRAAAMQALGSWPGDEGVAVLRHATDDPNASVALAAVDGLVVLGDPGAFRTLRRVFEACDPHQVRLARDLVSLAPETEDPGVVPFLVGVLQSHPQRWVRSAAVTALAPLRGPHSERVFSVICEALSDESFHVRRSAAEALAARGDTRATLQLQARRALEPDRFVLQTLDTVLDELAN